MKKLDRSIQNTVIVILIVTFLAITITDIKLAKNIIISIIFIAYFIFIAVHVFILMPFAMLLIVISEYIQKSKFYIKTKAKSDILAWWSIAVPATIAVFVIYWLIPVLTCMLYLETLNIGDGIEQLSKIMRK